jgi:hypothetical protein
LIGPASTHLRSALGDRGRCAHGGDRRSPSFRSAAGPFNDTDPLKASGSTTLTP